MRTSLQDLLPGLAPGSITMLNNISVNGGRSSPDDVVAYLEDGHLHVGELLLCVGIKSTTSSSTMFIAKWKQLELAGMWLMCEMSDTDVCQVDTKYLGRILPYRPAAQSRSVVFVLPELQPQWFCYDAGRPSSSTSLSSNSLIAKWCKMCDTDVCQVDIQYFDSVLP